MSEMKFGRPELKLGDNIKREIALLNKKEFDQTILQPDKSDPETKPDTRQGFLISEKSLTVKMNAVVLSRRATVQIAKKFNISTVKAQRAKDLEKNEVALLEECLLVLEELLLDLQANRTLTEKWIAWWLGYCRLKYGEPKYRDFNILLEEFLDRSWDYVQKKTK